MSLATHNGILRLYINSPWSNMTNHFESTIFVIPCIIPTSSVSERWVYHWARSSILIGAVPNAIDNQYSHSSSSDCIPNDIKNGRYVVVHHIALNILIAGILREPANAFFNEIRPLKWPSALFGVYHPKFVFASNIFVSIPNGYWDNAYA